VKLAQIIIQILVAMLIMGEVALAHHSAAGYDIEKRVAISGEVLKASFRNPHGTIELMGDAPAREVNAKGDIIGAETTTGEALEWEVETAAANLLRRRAWDFKKVKKGDTLMLIGHPAKDGSSNLYLREIRFPDGTVFGDPDGQDKALD